MKCPFCDSLNTQVKDSRPADEYAVIKRRRLCHQCLARFTTYERIYTREIRVIKKNGSKKPLDAQKILRSIEIATRKRPFTSDDLEVISSNVVKKIQKLGEAEISSGMIGGLLMEELIKVDKVAYVRYASVYMDFQKASDFKGFIQKIEEMDE
ncbi:MAG: transcriptional repressor NrdR [Candidatus Midichloriaceae bacterium]|jgi:transcriptional repressor NrdR